MKRFLFVFTAVMFVFIGVLYVSPLAHAQAPTAIPLPTQPLPSNTPPMLGSMVQSQACPQVAWSCATTTDLDPGSHEGPHRIQLTQGGLPPTDENGQPTKFYVACGIESPGGFLLTTNNREHDEKLCLGKDTSIKLHDDFIYYLEILNTANPFTSADGNVTVIVKPSNLGLPKTHMCMIGWVVPPSKTEKSQDNPTPYTNASSSIVYSTFTIAGQSTQTSAPPGVCTTVYTDPYGRVYNKQLKPVPGAVVSIFDYDSRSLLRVPGTPNPVTTDASGTFNFNIPPGKSYLQTSLTNEPIGVHPNFARAYTDPYTYGDLINEIAGHPEQRDIPVSGGSTPVLKLTGYSQLRFGDVEYIEGNATWPLTLVDVMQGATSIAHMQSDKFGNFAFKLDPMTIDPAVPLTLKLTEVDLTTNPTSPASNPATDSKTFDPIPAFIEGHAYDSQGKLVPFAKVRIHLKISDGIYYEASADKDGLYSIPPSHVPMFPYYLEVISPANAVNGVAGSKISVPVYAQQNKEYLATHTINVMTGTKNGSKVDPFNTGGILRKIRNTTAFGTSVITPSPTPEASTTKNYMIVFALLVALFLGGTSAVILYIKRRPDGTVQASGEAHQKKTYSKI